VSGIADRTVDAYLGDIEKLVGFLEPRGTVDPAPVTHTDLRDFLFHMKERGLAATSIRRALSSVRSYFGFLIEEGAIEADPTERLEAPRTWRKLPAVLTREEVAAILEAPAEDGRVYWRDRAILELLYATGVRVSELLDLRTNDVDQGERVVRVLGKGSRERIVPFGRAAGEAIRRYLATPVPGLHRREPGCCDPDSLPGPCSPVRRPDVQVRSMHSKIAGHATASR
jgi:integrase/recombinase XerD